MKINPDKIASVTKNVPLKTIVDISDMIIAKTGNIIAVKALEEKSVYNTLELVSGRMSKIIKGDIIIGVLGERKSQGGFVGNIPIEIKKGDILNILNLGGVIGKSVSGNPSVGEALKVEVLGSVVVDGKKANIKQNSISTNLELLNSAPIVMLSATGMNTGKTTAACKIIKQLHYKGYKIAAAKLTGVSLLSDVLKMYDSGASKILSFTDAGLPSTVNIDKNELIKSTKTIIFELNKINPDIIVLELGDGILGDYGVSNILSDKSIMQHVKCNLLCANDLVGSYGANEIFTKKFLQKIDIISGPVTDTCVGIDYITNVLKKVAVNAKTNAVELSKSVEAILFKTHHQNILKVKIEA